MRMKMRRHGDARPAMQERRKRVSGGIATLTQRDKRDESRVHSTIEKLHCGLLVLHAAVPCCRPQLLIA